MISQRNNKSKKQNKNRNSFKKAPNMRLNKNLNVYSKQGGVTTNVIYPRSVFAYSTTSNYSFDSSNDIRSLAFATVVSNSFPFSDYAALYTEYRVTSASAVLTPTRFVDTGLNLNNLYVTCDPEGSSGNPVNSVVNASQTAHIFSPRSLDPKFVNFTFPGVGINTDIWLPTTQSLVGSFYIGNSFTMTVGGTQVAFDASFSLVLQFRNMKSH